MSYKENLSMKIQQIADSDFEGDYNKAHEFLLRIGLIEYRFRMRTPRAKQ